MLRCPEPGCGQLNRPNARFCVRCGHPLREVHWSTLRAGHMLRGGAYRILGSLGKGGMGALYLAADTAAFDRKCVVKELLAYYDATDPAEARQAQARFEAEARLLAELSHPGIPRIYSYFSEAGRHFIVMEYIEGETLEQGVTHADAAGRLVAARPFPPEVIVRHAIRVCRVLEYLAGRPTPVIHQDIKPANLIVDRTSGEVRLVDFGTAQMRLLQPAGGDGASGFGTRGYSAPELYQGTSDPRSDVYALAVTVYHLLTDDDPGDHPFSFPQLSALPGSLGDVLERALRPELPRRSTAVDLRQGLEAWLIPAAAPQPFVFRSGAVANTTEDLVALADRYWDEARDHLANGDFQHWFRERNRHDLVAKADSARLDAHDDQDAALESFLQRLDPRLGAPRLAVEPLALDFHVSHARAVARPLTLRNEGRGYARAGLAASVPWLRFEPSDVGCLAGEERLVALYLDRSRLPFRRDHQAVVTVTPNRGPRLSVAVSAELSIGWEIARRVWAGLGAAAVRLGRGARRGGAAWVRTVRSLARSRFGPAVVLAEVLILAAALAALWWIWTGMSATAGMLALTFLQALPIAALAVVLMPALAFVGGGMILELFRRAGP